MSQDILHSTVILARKGCGKTYLMAHMAKSWNPDLIFIHDPMGCFFSPEYPWLHNAQEVGEHALVPGALWLLDEIDRLAPPNHFVHDWVHEAVHFCRHIPMAMICTARRPANINRDITSQADIAYLGKITEPRDLKYCYEYFGEITNDLPNLEKREFIACTP